MKYVDVAYHSYMPELVTSFATNFDTIDWSNPESWGSIDWSNPDNWGGSGTGTNYEDMYGGVNRQWIHCGGDMGCCMQLLCGSYVSDIMSNATLAVNMTDGFTCMNSGNITSCFENIPVATPFLNCLACNDCITRPVNLSCNISDTVDVMHFG